MKKILLLLTMLAACQTANQEEAVDCSPDYTYPISMQATWQEFEYDQPWCWVATDNGSNLQLEDPESEAFVRFTLSSEEMEDPTLMQMEIALEDGTLVYAILPTAFYEDTDVQILLSSFKKIVP